MADSRHGRFDALYPYENIDKEMGGDSGWLSDDSGCFGRYIVVVLSRMVNAIKVLYFVAKSEVIYAR